MNIDRNKYKVLKVLDANAPIKVAATDSFKKWLNESVSYNPNDITHIELIKRMYVCLRAQMRSNVIMVSEPIQKMAAENFHRMVDVLKDDWIKPQVGAYLDKDGGMFTYYIELVPDELPDNIDSEVVKQEQCKGTAVLCHYDKKGFMKNCAFVSSRVDYEHDNERRLMYDMHNLNRVTIAEFAPLLVILAFLQYADTEKVVIENGMKKNVRTSGEVIKNSTGEKVNYYDSRWIREIIKVGDYNVRGHFRMQRYGKGRMDKKLIYINEFVKHGYHRKAQKDEM